MKRITEPLQDSPGHDCGIALVLNMAEQNGELVAADARHHRLRWAALAGAGADAGAQPSRHVDEQLISGGVSQAVVHLLETVKIDEQYGK